MVNMETIDIINVGLGILSLVLAGVANIRISSQKDSNKIKNQKQVISGDNNRQAGRDIS